MQRLTAASSSSGAEASGWGSGIPDRDPDVPDTDAGDGYEAEGEDSKAVRLTLMEEVLLLGLKDREVSSDSQAAAVMVVATLLAAGGWVFSV